MYSRPRMLQGVFPFEGKGLAVSLPISDALTYVVPEGCRAQLIYFRGGNSAAEMVCATLTRDGAPMRLFPMGAKGATHVALAVIEDLMPGTRLEVLLSAPDGVRGEAVLDIAFIEMPDDGAH